MLEITVHEVRGRCPVHAVGDRIVIDGPHIISSQTDALCTHALATLLHYTTILEHAWCPVTLGLSTPDDPTHAYMQCVDPVHRSLMEAQLSFDADKPRVITPTADIIGGIHRSDSGFMDCRP